MNPLKTRRTRNAVLMLTFVCLPFLVGPAPGYTGGCDGGAPDPRQYCADKKAYTCVRDVDISINEGSLPESERNNQIGACIADIESTCSAAAWPASCRPSNESTARCIAALRDPNRITQRIASGALPECQGTAVCGTQLVSP